MKHLFQFKIIQFALFFFGSQFLFCSCSAVYFDQPVPKNSEIMITIPPEWEGLYEYSIEAGPENEDISPLEGLFRAYTRIERWSDTKMFMTFDRRLKESDWNALEKTLADMKQNRQLLDYQLTKRFIILNLPGEKNQGNETQFVSLHKENAWYVLEKSDVEEPVFLIDLGAKTISTLSRQDKPLTKEILPNSDSLEMKTLQLVARKKAGHYYLNEMSPTDEGGEGKYFLYHLYQPQSDEMIVQFSDLAMPKDTLKAHLPRLNRITAFHPIGDDKYHINPDDNALDKLLAYPGLFQELRLRKVKE